MPSADVFFSVAPIHCPLCGGKRFTVEKRTNLELSVYCKGKKQYVYIPAILKHVWTPIACPWGITLSKGDIVRAAIAKGDEDARKRADHRKESRERAARKAAVRRAVEATESVLAGKIGVSAIPESTGWKE